eukprot:79753-Pelagomonas_calceolata.AAC.11
MTHHCHILSRLLSYAPSFHHACPHTVSSNRDEFGLQTHHAFFTAMPHFDRSLAQTSLTYRQAVHKTMRQPPLSESTSSFAIVYASALSMQACSHARSPALLAAALLLCASACTSRHGL